MSLDTIQVPPLVMYDLYKNSLVALVNEQKKTKILSASPFNILGNNGKHILILIDHEATAFLPEQELNFLLGILSACKLTMEDVAILNIKKNDNCTYKQFTAALGSTILILFGVSPYQIQLPLEFPSYQVQAYNNQTYLIAPPLSNIEADKTEKTKLWNTLKKIFTI